MAGRQHSIEAIARARQLYAEGVRVAEISAVTGVPVGTLYFHFDRDPAGVAGSHLPRRNINIGRRGAVVKTPPPGGLAADLWRTAEAAARRVARLTESGRAVPATQARNLRALARMIDVMAAAEQSRAAAARVDFSAVAAGEIEAARAAAKVDVEISVVAARTEILRARMALAKSKLPAPKRPARGGAKRPARH